jgi:hypothetical protein
MAQLTPHLPEGTEPTGAYFLEAEPCSLSLCSGGRGARDERRVRAVENVLEVLRSPQVCTPSPYLVPIVITKSADHLQKNAGVSTPSLHLVTDVIAKGSA